MMRFSKFRKRLSIMTLKPTMMPITAGMLTWIRKKTIAPPTTPMLLTRPENPEI